MATIVVKDSNGRPVANIRVSANTVTKYAWGGFSRSGVTDEDGVCELTDRNERYRLLIDGKEVKSVDSLRSVIHIIKPS